MANFGTTTLVVAGLVSLLSLCAIAAVQEWRKRRKLGVRIAEMERLYAPAIEVSALVAEQETLLVRVKSEIAATTQSSKELAADYLTKRAVYERLDREVKALEDKLDFAELGVYEPTFLFENSKSYVSAIERNHEKQKAMIADGQACICEKNWTVDGSRRAGETMTKRAIRLTLRAFNNECEVAVSRVSWKNYERLVSRIQKSFEAINKLNSSNETFLTDEFLELKLSELRLTYEEKLRRKEEADELREQRARERDEAQAEREIQAEIRRAEEDEARRRDALERAKRELGDAAQNERNALQANIDELEEKLKLATETRERAMSMAEQTRAGYIYIISNIGAFGDNVFKIGMTRRLEPVERVNELGDASVPFAFDIHAICYTKDAPSLERKLHEALGEYRVNRVNSRKEFFKVPPDVLKERLRNHLDDINFKDTPEAEEFYLSLPPAAKKEVAVASPATSSFPATL